MFALIPGVLVVWGSAFVSVWPRSKGAFLLTGTLASAVLLGLHGPAVDALGETSALVAGYVLVAAFLLGVRAWARPEKLPTGRTRVDVRARRPARQARDERRAEALRRLHVDAPPAVAAQSRASELAARRAIRWKDSP